ncbi:glycosyl hydrolase family 28-related protein [Priestia megaterium]|uniref:glycosyl hydrolase family 28-related protein n=1 Tax=Priestia megaterium TaxID=1404 RepID=UPI003CFFD4C3
MLVIFIIASGFFFINQYESNRHFKTNSNINTNNVKESKSIYNVKDYGAKGDGLKDDTLKILSAVKEADNAGGGTIYLERGTYIVSSSIHIPSNVSLLGEGRTVTILKRKDNEDEAVLRLEGNQTIQNIGFSSRIGVLPMGDDITILQSKFNCSLQGIQNAITVHRLTIINTIFDRCGYGILSNLQPSFDVKIINCKFTNTKLDSIEINVASHRWLIENCTFDTNTSNSKWAGFGVGVALSAKHIVIKNSDFIDIVGQGVHVEDHSEVVIIGATFKNCGSDSYPGSPEADIAVLSNAMVKIANSVFYSSDKGYSNLAIFNTDKPVGGTVVVESSKFYNKDIGDNIFVKKSEFINP